VIPFHATGDRRARAVFRRWSAGSAPSATCPWRAPAPPSCKTRPLVRPSPHFNAGATPRW